MIECEACFANIGILQLKIPRTCIDCSGTFCTECTLPVENAIFDRRCQQCYILMSGRFNRTGLKDMRMKSILSFLKRRRINYSGCADKSDLVDVLCEVFKIPLDTGQPAASPPTGQDFSPESPPVPVSSVSSEHSISLDHQEGAATTAASQDSKQPAPSFPPPTYDESVSSPAIANATGETTGANDIGRPSAPQEGAASSSSHDSEENKFKDMIRVSISLIEDIDQIDLLSVNQLKQLLAANHMQITPGCKEKEELRQQVRMLFIAEQRRLQQKFSDDSVDWENTCKICMSNEIDCVLLDCGHLCCCLQCGKTLSECPMCRALVVRAVRVFKS